MCGEMIQAHLEDIEGHDGRDNLELDQLTHVLDTPQLESDTSRQETRDREREREVIRWVGT